MKTISDAFGFDNITELAEVQPQVAIQKTIKQTPEVTRVDPAELELAYIRDPVVKNSIDNKKQAIMTAGWNLVCKDEKVRQYFLDWFEKISETGDDITIDEVFARLFKYKMIYGNTPIETLLGKYTEDPNNIVDLVVCDPKRIDYAKLSDGTIAVDEYGKPLGYTQQLLYGTSTEGKGDPIPVGSNINLGSNQIFLLPKRIAMFKYDTYGDGFYSQGLIEAGYKSILYEMMVKRAHYNNLEQKSEGIWVDYVGDTFHQPTPQITNNAVETMKKFKNNRYFAFPYWHKIEPIVPKRTFDLIASLKYLREDKCASLGMPIAFATGSGEETNRATLGTLHLFLTLNLNNLVKDTMDQFKRLILKRICEFQKFEEVPRIVWNHIGVEEMNDKAKRIISYVDKGILTPEEVKDFVKDSERLNP